MPPSSRMWRTRSTCTNHPLLPFTVEVQLPLRSPSHLRPRNPQHEIHNHCHRQRNRQHRRAEPVIEPTLPSHPYALRTPVECDQGVDHGHQSYDREEAGGDLTHAVAEVQQADGQTAEDDGEVEPGEEGTFVGEEDFRLDAGGEGDTLAWGGCQW